MSGKYVGTYSCQLICPCPADSVHTGPNGECGGVNAFHIASGKSMTRTCPASTSSSATGSRRISPLVAGKWQWSSTTRPADRSGMLRRCTGNGWEWSARESRSRTGTRLLQMRHRRLFTPGGSRRVARGAFPATAAAGFSGAASVTPAASSRPDPREAALIAVLLILAAASWVFTATQLDGMDTGRSTGHGPLGFFVTTWFSCWRR